MNQVAVLNRAKSHVSAARERVLSNTQVKFVLRIVARLDDDNISLVAAGVAFHVFLSIFPALAVAISAYGLLFDVQSINEQIDALRGVLPQEALSLVAERAQSIVANRDETLTWGLILASLLSLWSANRAMKATADALNITYSLPEDRTFIQKNLITLALTAFSTFISVIVLTIVVIVPIFVTAYLSAQSTEITTAVVSWLIFIGIIISLFWVLYGYAPARHKRPWRALLPGACVAAALVVAASTAFSLYVVNFGKYDEQYGALGAVVVTLLWLYIGAFIFLLGAEINAERSAKTVGSLSSKRSETNVLP